MIGGKRYKQEILLMRKMNVINGMSHWCVMCIHPTVTRQECIVHFIGWSTKWDEPLDISSDRLDKRHAHSSGPHRHRRGKWDYSPPKEEEPPANTEPEPPSQDDPKPEVESEEETEPVHEALNSSVVPFLVTPSFVLQSDKIKELQEENSKLKQQLLEKNERCYVRKEVLEYDSIPKNEIQMTSQIKQQQAKID
eukprot:71984_1